MLAYAGSKAIGVNTNSKNMVAAVELAVYLGSAQAQRSHYELRSTIPCNTELLQEETFQNDPLVTAQNDTFDNTSILQPFVSAMNNCWTPVENMGKGIRNGSVTMENAEEQTQAMNEAITSTGIGRGPGPGEKRQIHLNDAADASRGGKNGNFEKESK